MGDIFFRDIPEELHRKFKSICAEKGISMKDAFIEYIKEQIVKKEKPPMAVAK